MKRHFPNPRRPGFYFIPKTAGSVFHLLHGPFDELTDGLVAGFDERAHAPFRVRRLHVALDAELPLREKAPIAEHRSANAHDRAAFTRRIENLRELVQFDPKGVLVARTVAGPNDAGAAGDITQRLSA